MIVGAVITGVGFSATTVVASAEAEKRRVTPPPRVPTELVFFLNSGDIPGTPGTATAALGAPIHTTSHLSISVVAYASKSLVPLHTSAV
jgi:hypothetical protein